MKVKILIILCLSIISTGYSKKLGGLILTGVDSIYTKNQWGYDLNYQKSCTTMISSSTCFHHFEFYYVDVHNSYSFATPTLGYSIKKYRMNLDSIKTAPADSFFYKNQNNIGDTISVDSLKSRIGNVYLLWTDVDPRVGVRFHAKIKILDIAVKDSAKHQVVFKFLYAFQMTGGTDIATSNLDTFHMEPTSTIASKLSIPSISLRQSVFKVFGNTFTMPQELAGTNAMLSLFDLKGRKLGVIETHGQKVVDVRSVAKGNGVMVVKYTPEGKNVP